MSPTSPFIINKWKILIIKRSWSCVINLLQTICPPGVQRHILLCISRYLYGGTQNFYVVRSSFPQQSAGVSASCLYPAFLCATFFLLLSYKISDILHQWPTLFSGRRKGYSHVQRACEIGWRVDRAETSIYNHIESTQYFLKCL